MIIASWKQLQPTPSSELGDDNVIDNMLAEIHTYNLNHPNKPLAVKLRVWGGFMAPNWAKQIGGAPIAFTHAGHPRTSAGSGRRPIARPSPGCRACWRRNTTPSR